ncbi:LLM class flavin-dependent oxidoreductase [Gluconacetobacter tumulisoli]|uniref:LLM class flavin-dependent oxidoreductase n=1 Tax=Gluconacetobacter tumulisoli TaxID=1286189 RepID=A0A7W4K726_9PROT|nr:LLM class flavin-dependent oxidoreductase [Gluconacetobacter tumulisoli]MBB2201498.1 LLM class flavin-dependent oxidoreductase [Gluconacetobacter tumulisoli]
MTRQMHLVAFLMAGPTSHHHGMWRHPESENAFLDPAAYEHVARVLERGCFDGLFFADVLGIPDNFQGGYDTMVRRGGQLTLLDPIPLLAIMARATRHIGLGATISTTFHNPYQIARTLATMDIISQGRAAWNVVTSASTLEARNFGADALPARNARYDRADEVLEACMALWRSWDDDAIVLDKEQGVFADPSRLHRTDYQGKWVRTAGPLTAPRGPQGHPVIMQAGSSDRGRAFAARWSEMIFTLQHALEDMQAFYTDIKTRMAALGRAPGECAILTSVDPIIGETESIAREKQEYVNSLIDTDLALALVSSQTGIDLSRYPADRPIEDIALEEGSRGSFDIIVRVTRSEGLTLGEVARRFATSELCPQIVGTPESVADQLQFYFENHGCDGFIVTPTAFPGTFETFARSVVPILQKRGIFRRNYTGRTLRENLRG